MLSSLLFVIEGWTRESSFPCMIRETNKQCLGLTNVNKINLSSGTHKSNQTIQESRTAKPNFQKPEPPKFKLNDWAQTVLSSLRKPNSKKVEKPSYISSSWMTEPLLLKQKLQSPRERRRLHWMFQRSRSWISNSVQSLVPSIINKKSVENFCFKFMKHFGWSLGSPSYQATGSRQAREMP